MLLAAAGACTVYWLIVCARMPHPIPAADATAAAAPSSSRRGEYTQLPSSSPADAAAASEQLESSAETAEPETAAVSTDGEEAESDERDDDSAAVPADAPGDTHQESRLDCSSAADSSQQQPSEGWGKTMGLLRVSYLASYLAFLLAVGVLLLATIVLDGGGGNQQQPAARVDTDSGGAELTASQTDLPLGEAGDGSSSSSSSVVWVTACSDEAVAKRLYLLMACMLAVVQVSPLVSMAREDGGTRLEKHRFSPFLLTKTIVYQGRLGVDVLKTEAK
eukprot:COSAG06_NODE_2247_length_7259_cov_24.660506_1_plen_277_part_00